MEKTSRFEEAFLLLSKHLNSSIQYFIESDFNNSWNQITSQVISIIGFCQRCSTKTIDTKEKELYWLTLLELVLKLTQQIEARNKSQSLGQNLIEETHDLMNRLIETMKDSINLTPVMETIMSKDSITKDSQQACQLFAIVYENYSYEETLLQTTNNLLLSELHQHLAHLRKEVNKAKASRNKWCSLCSTSLDIEPIILFNCMHSFHHKCVTKRVNPPKCLSCDSSSKDSPEDESTHLLNLCDHSNHENEQKIIDSNEKLRNTLKLNETQVKALEKLRSDQRIDSKVSALIFYN